MARARGVVQRGSLTLADRDLRPSIRHWAGGRRRSRRGGRRIKRLVANNCYRFSRKALDELKAKNLDPQDTVEAVLNAQRISKTLRSASPRRGPGREKLYVIEGFNSSKPSLLSD